MNEARRTHWVVEQAKAQGFDLCGVTSVEDYVAALAQVPEWLARGYAGEMKYLHDARRLDPQRVLPGTRSIIVCAMNYFTDSVASQHRAQHAAPLRNEAPVGQTSRYAWGDDYHEVLGAKLEKLVASMKAEIAEPFEALWYVDTGPVVERVAAQRAGLGWLAKNTCLINEELGSWLFLGVILTTLELRPSLSCEMGSDTEASQAIRQENGKGKLENGRAFGHPSRATSHLSTPMGSSLTPDPQPLTPAPDLCGHCTMCLEACPTQAFAAPYVLDARKCISYLTIELRGSIPAELREPMGQMVFGCDICQEVCPWNRRAPVTSRGEFAPRKLPGAVKSGKGEIRKSKIETRRPNTSSSKSESRETSHESPITSHSLLTPELEWLASLTEEEFREVFHGSAVKRAKRRGLVRNACVALGNGLARPERSGLRPGTEARARVTSLLERLSSSEDELICEHARWALEQARPG